MSKGVFNADAHQEEVQMLMQGLIKQVQIVAIDVSQQGLAKTQGNSQGEFDMEGNALVAMPTYLNNDFKLFTSVAQDTPPIYVRFNHPDQPWLPLGVAATAAGLMPCSYTLTFGRFWIYTPNAIAGQSLYLAVVRAVCMYSAGIAPTVQAAYSAPTWVGLR